MAACRQMVLEEVPTAAVVPVEAFGFRSAHSRVPEASRLAAATVITSAAGVVAAGSRSIMPPTLSPDPFPLAAVLGTRLVAQARFILEGIIKRTISFWIIAD